MPSSGQARAARIIAALVACLLGPGSARADWVFAPFLGHAETHSSTVVLTLPSQGTRLEISGVEYRGESFRSPVYYGGRLTWIPDRHRWMGIEGEWIHAKVYAETSQVVRVRGTLQGVAIDASLPLETIVQRLSMSHGLNFILANFALRRELGPVDSRGIHRVLAVVRAGAGPMRPHAESEIGRIGRQQYENGGLGMQVGGGVEFLLWRGFGALGEYKFTWASPEIEVAGGRAKVPARSHHFVMGLRYGF